MKNPLISVIVPVYKVEEYLDRCVQSILDQDYTKFELILVDDGSPDRCGKMCDDWSARDHRITAFHKLNGGLSSARNYGIDQVRGEYITFVDSDDWVSTDYLSYLLSLFEGHPDCAVACCNHYVVRNGRSTLAINENREKWVLSRKQAFEEALFHGCIDVSAWAKLYHVSIFKELRYPEGRIFEDTWLFGDIVNRTKEIVCGRKGCYYYEVRSNSLVNSAFKQKNMEFIESAKKLGADAVAYAPELQVGSIRRVNHARMSVLRYMEHCDKEYRELQKQLRADILSCASEYLSHPRTPARDKAAVACLRLGLKPFYAGWRLYTKLRER